MTTAANIQNAIQYGISNHITEAEIRELYAAAMQGTVQAVVLSHHKVQDLINISPRMSILIEEYTALRDLKPEDPEKYLEHLYDNASEMAKEVYRLGRVYS